MSRMELIISRVRESTGVNVRVRICRFLGGTRIIDVSFCEDCGSVHGQVEPVDARTDIARLAYHAARKLRRRLKLIDGLVTTSATIPSQP